MASVRTPTTSNIVARIAAGLLGGYVFTLGFVMLGIALLLAIGWGYDDSRTLVFLVAFIAFLVAFLSAFIVSRLLRLWFVLAGGGAAMIVLASLLTHSAP
jgi:hypothetical protein